jgi:hypothetical protein
MFKQSLISISKQLSSCKSSSRNATSLAGKNFMCIQDLSTAELEGLIDHSIALKEVANNAIRIAACFDLASFTTRHFVVPTPNWRERLSL